MITHAEIAGRGRVRKLSPQQTLSANYTSRPVRHRIEIQPYYFGDLPHSEAQEGIKATRKPLKRHDNNRIIQYRSFGVIFFLTPATI